MFIADPNILKFIMIAQFAFGAELDSDLDCQHKLISKENGQEYNRADWNK
jgi:hypothetical protein